MSKSAACALSVAPSERARPCLSAADRAWPGCPAQTQSSRSSRRLPRFPLEFGNLTYMFWSNQRGSGRLMRLCAATDSRPTWKRRSRNSQFARDEHRGSCGRLRPAYSFGRADRAWHAECHLGKSREHRHGLGCRRARCRPPSLGDPLRLSPLVTRSVEGHAGGRLQALPLARDRPPRLNALGVL